MTPLTTLTHRRHGRTLGIMGTALVIALAVAGCSAPAPEATPAASSAPSASATPTPIPTAESGAIEEPKNAEEGIEGATEAATAYYALRTQIEVEHPADSSAIDAVAVGTAAEAVHESARKLVASGMTYAGEFTYDVTSDSYISSSTAPDGTVYPFGTAHLVGCVDASGISATNADGSAVEMNPNSRGILNLTVVYYPAEKTWLVQDVRAPEEVIPC
jgi:hypothetical protein